MRLFISYAHRDKYHFVKEFVSWLNRAGHKPWWDEELIAGRTWQEELNVAIKKCSVFIYVVSRDSVNSEWCQWEFAEAGKLVKPVIPVLYRADCKLPEEISALQYVDCTQGLTTDATAALTRSLLSPIKLKKIPSAPSNPQGDPPQARGSHLRTPHYLSEIGVETAANLASLEMPSSVETIKVPQGTDKQVINIAPLKSDSQHTKQAMPTALPEETKEQSTKDDLLSVIEGELKDDLQKTSDYEGKKLEDDPHSTDDDHTLKDKSETGSQGEISSPSTIDESTPDEEIKTQPDNETSDDPQSVTGKSNGALEVVILIVLIFAFIGVMASISELTRLTRPATLTATATPADNQTLGFLQYMNQANTYFSQFEYSRAITELDQAITELNQIIATAYKNRAGANYEQHNYEAAINDYGRAIEINESYIEAYYNRGRAYYAQNQFEQAIADYNYALQLDPNYAFALLGLAETYAGQGRNSEALITYNRFRELAGNIADPFILGRMRQLELLLNVTPVGILPG